MRDKQQAGMSTQQEQESHLNFHVDCDDGDDDDDDDRDDGDIKEKDIEANPTFCTSGEISIFLPSILF